MKRNLFRARRALVTRSAGIALCCAISSMASPTSADVGALLIKRIRPGTANHQNRSRSVSNLTKVGDLLFFVGDDAEHGAELWRSDGTADGTQIVRDIIPGAIGSEPRFLTAASEILYFVVREPRGQRLWRSDGSAEGTQPLVAIGAAPHREFAPWLTPMGSSLFFVSWGPWATSNLSGISTEIWRSDGSPAGTMPVLGHPKISQGRVWSRMELTAVGRTLFFTSDDREVGRELWRTTGDGTGVALVADITPGRLGAFDYNELLPPEFTAFGDHLLFIAEDPVHGMELRRSDGTAAGTTIIKDIHPGPGWSNPARLAVVGKRVFFVADDGRSGRELWQSDGTAAGTELVKDIHAGPAGSLEFDNVRSPEFTDIGGRLFLVADDGEHGIELWTSDGTANGTVLVKDIRFGAESSAPSLLTNAHGSLVFLADDGEGAAVWRSDGTSAGTVRVFRPAGATSFSPPSLTAVGQQVFFSCDCDGGGEGLWAIALSALSRPAAE